MKEDRVDTLLEIISIDIRRQQGSAYGICAAFSGDSEHNIIQTEVETESLTSVDLRRTEHDDVLRIFTRPCFRKGSGC